MSLKNSLSKASILTFRASDLCLTRLSSPGLRSFRSNPLDWDDSQTDLANLAGAGSAGSAAGGDKLWEDNWDDDDIEEEFSTQLRLVVLLRPGFTHF